MSSEIHVQRLEQLRKWEEAQSPQTIISTPMNLDIVFGKGCCLQDHPGNLRFRYIIEESLSRYEDAKRSEKTKIASAVVKTLKDSGARFLRNDGMGFMIVDDKVAREKVGVAFRSHRKIQKEEKARAKRTLAASGA